MPQTIRLYHGHPKVRDGSHATFAVSDADRKNIRWLYRYIRRDGLAASTARLAVVHLLIIGEQSEWYRNFYAERVAA